MDILVQPPVLPIDVNAPIRPDDPNLSDAQQETLRLIEEGIADAQAGRVRPGTEALRMVLARHGL